MSYSVAAFTANFQCQFAGRGFEWSCIKNFLKNPVVYFAFEHFVFSATELQLDNAKAAVLTAFDVRSDQFTFFASCNIRVLFLYRISAVYVVIFFAYFASCDTLVITPAFPSISLKILIHLSMLFPIFILILFRFIISCLAKQPLVGGWLQCAVCTGFGSNDRAHPRVRTRGVLLLPQSRGVSSTPDHTRHHEPHS